ncbi:MAG: hypothetical protein LBI38_05200 [Oscillospiraceae bacterium]|jgi:hypothetical protein|nr:hypothetical protein [Oscillospiraceae bacterium]
MGNSEFASRDAYENYVNEKTLIKNHKLRGDNQTFGDAMREGGIADGLEEKEKILEIIRNAGRI